MSDGRHDIGQGITIWWDQDGRGFHWKHPECKAWMPLRFKPDPQSTGHVLLRGGPDAMQELTILGSLLCPKGCGKHGEIADGRWIPC